MTQPDLADRNYTVGPDGDFADLNTAMAVLNKWVLTPGAYTTLTLLDGMLASGTPVAVESSFGKQIKIVGKNVYAKTLSGVQSSSGATGAWSVVLNINSVINVSVGDYAVLHDLANGTNPAYLAGAWRITAVDATNSRITIASTHRAASAPAGAITGTVKIIKSVLKFNGCDGFRIWNGAAAINLDNFVIVGDGTAGTRGIANDDCDRVFVNTLLAVSGFSGSGGIGFASLQNCETNSDGILVASSCEKGFYCRLGGSIASAAVISSGNSSDGVGLDSGGVFYAGSASVFTGNGNNGVHAVEGGIASVASTTATGNGAWGYLAESQGYINDTSVAGANNTSGLSSTGIVASAANLGGSTFDANGDLLLKASAKIVPTTTGGAAIRGSASSATFPTLVPNWGSSNTGWGGTSGNLSAIVGGAEKIRLTSTETQFLQPMLTNSTSLPTSNPGAGRLWNNGGVVTVGT